MLIVSLIVFEVLIFAGLIFMFRRILNQNVISATKHLDDLNQDYVKKEEEVERRLQEAKQQSQEILAKAQNEADELKVQINKEVQDEKDKLLKQARIRAEEMIEQADKARRQLLTEIEDRISKEAVNKSCELLHDVLPEEFKQIVHKQWVDDLIENGFSQVERLHIPPDIGEAKIVSAFALSDEHRKKLSRKLKDALGHEVVLKEELNPKVVAGLIITLGSLVLDGSLKNKIQEKAR